MTAPEQKPKETAEEFLSRWSKRKQELRAEAQAPLPMQPAAPATPVPELPPVDKLTMDSDYSGFFHPKVDEALRRTALKKLFSDPHFNIPDPYEAYSGDWTGGEPIPEAMLASLEQMKTLLRKPPEAGPEAKEKVIEEKAKPDSDEPGRQDT